MSKLTEHQRARRDRISAAILRAGDEGFAATLRQARLIRTANRYRLYADHGSFDRYCEEDLEMSDGRAYHLIKLADAYDELVASGEEPLRVLGHVEEVYAVIGTGVLPEVVRRARVMASEEGRALAGRHLKTARDKVILSVEEVPPDGASRIRDGAGPDPVLSPGLSIVVPHDDPAVGSTVGVRVPSGVVVPWEPAYVGLLDSSASATPIGRTDLDPVADLVWSVLAQSPSAPPTTWAPGAGPFAATLFPDRIGQTTVRDPHLKRTDVGRDGRPDGCARTVLVAPGVDLFHEEIPFDVAKAVMTAIGSNPERRYVVLTSNVQRAAAAECPANAVIVVQATRAHEAQEMSAVANGAGSIVWGILLRDLDEPIPESALMPFDWVLMRGERTSQEAFSSVVSALRGRTEPHVGPEVRARLSGFPALPGLDLSPPDERPSATIHTRRRAPSGAALPPAA